MPGMTRSTSTSHEYVPSTAPAVQPRFFADDTDGASLPESIPSMRAFIAASTSTSVGPLAQ